MKISLLGHSCFYIELDNGIRIITDPYQHRAYSGAVRYLPVAAKADIVTVSHHHADHDFTEDVPGAEVIDSAGTFNIKGVSIEGISSYHDKSQGADRGKNVIFLIDGDGLKLAHFGDVGTIDLDYGKLSGIDIAMIPVGGLFTINHKEAAELIDKIKPKAAIPMHFKTSKIGFDIDGVDQFISGKTNVEMVNFLEVTRKTLSPSTKIYVFKHLR